jgi:hypothetical protein
MTLPRVLALLLLTGLAACVGGGGGGPVSPVIMQSSASFDELLNAYRAERGLGPLRLDARLAAAAAAHARDLAAHNRLSHRGSDGSSHIRRAERAGYGPYVAENVAAGQKTPAELMQAWLGSRGHRSTMELDPATHYGFAHAVAPGTQYRHFWVLEVGRPRPEEPAPVKAVDAGPDRAPATPGASLLTLTIGGSTP